MFFRSPKTPPADLARRELEAKVAAISRSQAVIEFDLDGCILDANANFLNVMQYALISPTARLGEGVLLNAGAAVHHDARVGPYCEISPGARVLGRCQVGAGCQIGAHAIILPDLVLGDGVRVGAGAVVTKSVPAGATVAGVPARVLC